MSLHATSRIPYRIVLAYLVFDQQPFLIATKPLLSNDRTS
jgi:hypothetical protein